MDVRKLLAILVLFLGLLILIVGIRLVDRGKSPNTCVVDFAKSLGGKASFDLRQSSQKDRYYGKAGIILGTVFICAGGVFLFKLKK